MNTSHEELTYEDELRPWEVETTFNDVLAQQLAHAPYFIASIVLHFLIGLIVAGIMVLTAKPEDEVPTLVAAPTPPPPEIEEEEEPEPEIIEEPIEEPVIVESDLEEVVEQETLQEDGDPDMNSDAAFDSDAWNNDVGLGGGAGGKMGGRGGRGGGGGSKTEASVQNGLKWLRDHQSPAGFWDSDEFMHNDVYPDKPQSTGEGDPVVDVGLTGLALLAFLGNGQTMDKGKFKNVVKSGVNWLKDSQNDYGLFGEEVGNATLYNQSIATMALGEAYYFSKQSPLLKRPMKKAVMVLINAQNDYNAWRYELEPDNDNDSSITGWMVFALKTAKENKMAISNSVFEGAENWFRTMTDDNTGRTGYVLTNEAPDYGKGSLPSRHEYYIMEGRFPGNKSEALTAVALLSRIFMTDGEKVTKWTEHPLYEIMKKQADLISSKPPKWDEEDGSIDMYYWYYATYAMKQWGGKHWTDWEKALKKALVPTQRAEDEKDNYYGSWDPIGPWGPDGGRVYSTAICVLMLEVFYRYSEVLGAR